MTYLAADGAWNGLVLPLTWGLLILSLAVIVIIALLVLFGAVPRARLIPIQDVPLTDSHATLWIAIGVAVSTLVLLGFVGWNSMTMAKVANPPSEPALDIEVRGHQWWWEFVYLNKDPSQIFITANEIHVPVGKPVRFALKTADVIHSFWVPRLAGKTDTIPGQTNVAWFEADHPGVYRGQCAQYCGMQHAHMILAVYADRPDEFESWRKAQLQAAPEPSSNEARIGEDLFIERCGACHAVRGTTAMGHVGPDLTHLMSRNTIAAGTLPNNPGFLSGWIANPQDLKPGALMPRPDISGSDLASIRSFLLTLR
ncbi:MAG: cytochrome c oxidase subunit II [Methylobacteriaceae bacterium]|nr:cytochrome c oxidase subunit II [Methylobacteriaceae bacterium]MBV9290145.1 cytochrome c oxidase subunit II [Hyphomicrobiales bacterium]